MKVIVCGSRDYDVEGYIWSLLDFEYSWVEDSGDPFIVIEGGAKGADASAAAWADHKFEYMTPGHGIEHRRFPADWDKFGKQAGYIRNTQMLDEGPDLVLAFINKPLPESRGTAHMVGIARAAGVRTVVVEVNH